MAEKDSDNSSKPLKTQQKATVTSDPEQPEVESTEHGEDEGALPAEEDAALEKKQKRKPGESSKQKSIHQKDIDVLLKNNPALGKELAGQSPAKIEEVLRKLSINDLMTGMVRLLQYNLTLKGDL